MSGPAELGRKGLPQADLLSAAPERRPLCRLGAAGGDRGRPSRRFPFAALNQGPGGGDRGRNTSAMVCGRMGGGASKDAKGCPASEGTRKKHSFLESTLQVLFLRL